MYFAQFHRMTEAVWCKLGGYPLKVIACFMEALRNFICNRFEFVLSRYFRVDNWLQVLIHIHLHDCFCLMEQHKDVIPIGLTISVIVTEVLFVNALTRDERFREFFMLVKAFNRSVNRRNLNVSIH